MSIAGIALFIGVRDVSVESKFNAGVNVVGGLDEKFVLFCRWCNLRCNRQEHARFFLFSLLG